jgi:hypothetical protein
MIVKAAAFLAREMSSVRLWERERSLVFGYNFFLLQRDCTYEAKRALSWFSRNVPRRVESLQVDLTVLIAL